MPGTANPRGDELRAVEWLTTFADREGPRAQIDQLLYKLAQKYEKPDFPILQFYGVSGQGKSALFRNTQEYAAKRYPTIRQAFVDLDQLDASRVTSPVEVLWQITDALASSGVAAPLTLCLYAHYWRKQNPGQEFRPDLIFKEDFLERSIRGCEILSPFEGILHGISDVGQSGFKFVSALQKLWHTAKENYHGLKIADARGSDPGTWDIARMEGSFSEFLALDILNYLRAKPEDRVCIAIDTFERIDPHSGLTQGNDSVERAFQDLCGRLVAGRDAGTAVLLFGRERLRWERYDAAGTADPWSRYIDSHELNGFTEDAALSFLRHEFSDFWKARGAAEVGVQLVANEEAILRASEEQTPGGRTFLPYYLRLAGEMIYLQQEQFVPEMLGHSPHEMQQRFLKYLREKAPEKLRAMQVLALALSFDEELFQHLHRAGHIVGVPIHGIETDLVGNRSYVRRFIDGGKVTYRFHRHMQQALLDDLEKNSGEVAAAGVVIEVILEFYRAKSEFATPAEFVAEKHLPAYEQGMEILLGFAERRWISKEMSANWFNRFEKPFDDHTETAVRIRVLERKVGNWPDLWGPSHPETGASLNHLASLYRAQGKYEPAERLYQQALTILEKGLGPEHPRTVASFSNLGLLYLEQGKYKLAEPFQKRDLAISEKVFGSEHPHTATSLNNLALLYGAKGQYELAEPLFQRALAIWKKKSGPEHPNTAQILNNLADLYRDQGKYELAGQLYLSAVTIREKILGPHHPDTGRSLNNLAELCRSQGKYEFAERLYQRALGIQEKALGGEHPDFAASLNNLGLVYWTQGKYGLAEPLFRRALAICEGALGGDHPNTAQCLNNLALLYQAQTKSELAEPLFVLALAIRERLLGAEHPNTAESLHNLAGLYWSLGRLELAEPMFQRALAIWEHILGEEHPTVATCRKHYAFLLKAMGRDAEAEVLKARAKGIRWREPDKS